MGLFGPIVRTEGCNRGVLGNVGRNTSWGRGGDVLRVKGSRLGNESLDAIRMRVVQPGERFRGGISRLVVWYSQSNQFLLTMGGVINQIGSRLRVHYGGNRLSEGIPGGFIVVVV